MLGLLLANTFAGCGDDDAGDEPVDDGGSPSLDGATFDPDRTYPGEGDACRYSVDCGPQQICVDDVCERHERVEAAELVLGELRLQDEAEARASAHYQDPPIAWDELFDGYLGSRDDEPVPLLALKSQVGHGPTLLAAAHEQAMGVSTRCQGVVLGPEGVEVVAAPVWCDEVALSPSGDAYAVSNVFEFGGGNAAWLMAPQVDDALPAGPPVTDIRGEVLIPEAVLGSREMHGAAMHDGEALYTTFAGTDSSGSDRLTLVRFVDEEWSVVPIGGSQTIEGYWGYPVMHSGELALLVLSRDPEADDWHPTKTLSLVDLSSGESMMRFAVPPETSGPAGTYSCAARVAHFQDQWVWSWRDTDVASSVVCADHIEGPSGPLATALWDSDADGPCVPHPSILTDGVGSPQGARMAPAWLGHPSAAYVQLHGCPDGEFENCATLRLVGEDGVPGMQVRWDRTVGMNASGLHAVSRFGRTIEGLQLRADADGVYLALWEVALGRR